MSELSLNSLLAVPLAPLVGSIAAGLLGKTIGRRASHVLTILGVLVSFIISAMTLKAVAVEGAHFNATVYEWMTLGSLKMEVGFLVDGLTAMMMCVVTFVSLMVHIYTIGYMEEDDGYQRFFSYISLFTFSMLGIVIAGTLGSWIGATIMYWASRWLGRPLVLRYGKYFLIPEEKVHAAERWAAQYGDGGVFFSRLLPVIRHLVGIPFGIVQMNFWRYSLFTILGSGLWCTVLTVVGVQAGQNEALMQGDLHQITLWAIGGVAVLGTLYYFMVHRAMSKPRES